VCAISRLAEALRPIPLQCFGARILKQRGNSKPGAGSANRVGQGVPQTQQYHNHKGFGLGPSLRKNDTRPGVIYYGR
jgi:hypothetical protein